MRRCSHARLYSRRRPHSPVNARGPPVGATGELGARPSLKSVSTHANRSAEETRRADAIVELLIHHASALLHPASSTSTAPVTSSARSSTAAPVRRVAPP